MPKKYYSTSEAANILHISRVWVFKRIKQGKIKAEKIGRNYLITHDDLLEALGQSIGESSKVRVEKVLNKALRQYEETFKRLGRE